MAFLAQVSTQQVITKSISTLTLDVSSITGIVLGAVQPQDITSTTQGLGMLGYISSAQLVSTVQGLGQIYLSTGGGGGTTFLVPSTFSTVRLLTSSVTASTVTGITLSTLQLNASTATMTVGTASSIVTNTMTIGSGSGWILTSPIQTLALSTNTLYAEQTYVTTENATTALLSTVTTNQLTVGTGGGWILTSPLQTSIVSSIYSFADTGYFNTVNVGSVSTVNSIQFAGLFNAYSNTALAEISTGAGTQELLVFKGSSASDRIRLQTTGAFVVETGVSSRLWNSNTTQTLSNATPAFVINTSSNVGIQTASPGATLDVAGTARAIVLSSQQLFTSSVLATVVTAPVLSTLALNASTATAAIVTASTVNTNALTLATNPSWILISPIQSLGVSTNTLWADQAYINTGVITTGTVSTMTTNALTLGTGATWIQTAPIQTSIVSSILTFADTTYFNTVNVGSVSTVNSIQFAGLFNAYSNTALAEISTGAGTQELLVFKGSSASDRVRVQTTGAFVVETGVSSRLWNSNTTQTLSNATPAFVINTSSNVGIQTASPGATLDVAGTARAVTLSSQQLFVSSVNGGLLLSGTSLVSSVAGLGTAGYLSTPPLFLSTAAFFTSSAVMSTATIGIMSSLQVFASTATIPLVTASSVTTNAVTIGSVPSWIQISPIQTAALSTNTLWADQSYVTTETVTTGIISAITTNSLTVGTGGAWLQTAPIQTSILSTIYLYASQPYVDTLFVGSASTVNSVQYAGLFNSYNNTALAEISTGAGTQELLVFKGSSASDRVRVQTTGAFVVETGVSQRLFNSNTTQTLSNATPAFIINTSSNVGIQTASPGATLDVAGTARAITLSSQQLFVSSVMAGTVSFSNLTTAAFFTSSAVISTATLGIMSSLVTNASTVTANIVTASTVNTNGLSLATSPTWILTAPLMNLGVSTNTLWADQAYINTGVITSGTVSTMTTNALNLGSGATWIQAGPLLTPVVSTIFLYANQPFLDTVNVGSVSTVNSLEFAGLFNAYNNTVLAEISTGAGTQEFLVFKGSSASDRVRVQTTGAFVVETGVSSRLFNSNTTQTLSNATPAFVINTSSNVGIQTANPGATLDVAGSGRFQTVSTQAIFASSIVAPYVFASQFITF